MGGMGVDLGLGLSGGGGGNRYGIPGLGISDEYTTARVTGTLCRVHLNEEVAWEWG